MPTYLRTTPHRAALLLCVFALPAAACTSMEDASTTGEAIDVEAEVGDSAGTDPSPATGEDGRWSDAGDPEPAPADAGTEEADASCEGCFGAPCESHDDCISGWCLDGPDGLSCSETCLDACPAGYSCRQLANEVGDPVFVCVYVHVAWCTPCNVDADCAALSAGARGVCVEAAGDAGGRFCATPCEVDCPPASTCRDEICVPDGECTCSPRAIEMNAETGCTLSNSYGSCEGVRRCTTEGLSDCDAAVPAEEICNEVDDDCDGAVDEGFEARGEVCDGDDEDLCLDGIFVCGDSGALVCSDSPESRVEICNDEDDDCDGERDEGFEAAKGQPCDGNDADLCADGVFVCDSGGLRCDDDDATVAEVCNGTDDDCDGSTDEDFAEAGEECDPGGPCLDGTMQCTGGEATCVATVRPNCCGNGLQEGGEICDGDCPGSCDDGNGCTRDSLTGSASACDAVCTFTFDPEADAGSDRCVCVDASPAPEVRCNPFESGQVWIGGYLGCPQGATDLTLRVESVSAMEVSAIFEFSYVPDDVFGQYYVRGAYEAATRSIRLDPVSWIVEPVDYVMVGMNGRVTGDGEFYSGQITAGDCRNFVVNLEQ